MKKPVIFILLLAPQLLPAQADSSVRKLLPEKAVEAVAKNLEFLRDKSATEDLSTFYKVEYLLKHKPEAFISIQAKGIYERIRLMMADTRRAASDMLAPRIAPDDPLETPQATQSLIPRRERLKGPASYDSRIELRQLNPMISWQKGILQNARSVGLVIRREQLNAVTDSLYELNTTLTLGKRYQLCPGQAFADQPVAGEGTAFLISSNECITAAHVVSGSPECYALVFGFELVNSTGAYTKMINKKDIYYFTAVAGGDRSLDVIKLRIDRAADRPAVKLSQATGQPPGTEVYMLGHPSGLPQKAAVNASIQQSNDRYSFYTTLDAFAGNSGSPVFDMGSHEVIGVLVSGAADFSWNGSCYVVSTCRVPYCKGERAVRVATLQGILSLVVSGRHR